MKKIFIVSVLLLNSLYAEEFSKIDMLIESMVKLKSEYKDLKAENKVLKEDINVYINYEAREITYKKEIKDLKAKLEIATKKLENSKSTDAKVTSNEFPQLQMKKRYQKKEKEVVVIKEKVDEVMMDDSEITYFQASPFRANKEAEIFDDINGMEIAVWEKSTSFTSNQRTDNWIKITGYFIEKVWQKADEEMWIKATDADKR